MLNSGETNSKATHGASPTVLYGFVLARVFNQILYKGSSKGLKKGFVRFISESSYLGLHTGSLVLAG